MSIFSDEIYAELCATDLPHAICDSARSSRGLEAIDALAGPKSLNRDQKQCLEAISILYPWPRARLGLASSPKCQQLHESNSPLVQA
jgi:hypothetical protein